MDAVNHKGETALHMAAKNGHAQVVCALLTGGADVSFTDKMGYTALHHCCITNGGEDVADALLEVGAGVNVQAADAGGKNTPLHFACMAGNHRMVDVLLKAKERVNLSLRNNKDQVPYMAADKAGHDNVKHKLQPVRTHLSSHLEKIDTLETFIEARKFVREYGGSTTGLQRLKRELIATGFVDKATGQLTTGTSPFNVFARMGAGKMPGGKPILSPGFDS